MDKWVFNFPTLLKQNAMDVEYDETDNLYPRKLLYWIATLPANATEVKASYTANAFTDVQLELYSAIFRFYGRSLLEEEVRIFAALTNGPVDDYLAIVLRDYLALQEDLQNLFKLSPFKLYYINAIERRKLFIDIQLARARLNITDIESYEIPPFGLLKPFSTPRMPLGHYETTKTMFWENIKKLNNIDPYGNLYLTKSLDFDALRALLNKFPKYNDYFIERNCLKSIIAEITTLFNSLIISVEKMVGSINERDALSGMIHVDILEKQERILSSRKLEQLFVQVNLKITKLNKIFLKFNSTFVLTGTSRDYIDLKKLTDNFFYSDYLSARESITDGLRIKLNDLLKTLH